MRLYRRDGSFVKVLEFSSATLEKRLMGVFQLRATLTSAGDVAVGDLIKIIYNGKEYTFKVITVNANQIEADHLFTELGMRVFLDKFIGATPSLSDKMELADVALSEILHYLRNQTIELGFEIENRATTTDRHDISFASDSLLSALQKICETWGVEFDVEDNKIVVMDEIITQRRFLAVEGVNAQKIDKQVDFSEVVTRVYPLGSNRNLPPNYLYDRLRPTNFNLETGIHSGSFHIEDAAAIAKWGVREKVVEFPDVAVRSFRGTVRATGRANFQNLTSVPYIEDPALKELDPTKVRECTLYVTKDLVAAELAVLGLDKAAGRLFFSPYLRDGSVLSWLPEPGSEYILVGYITQAEIDRAVQELRQCAQKYLDEHKEPRVTYRLMNAVFDSQIDVGDVIELQDDQRRVVAFSYDLVRGYYPSIELSDKPLKITSPVLREQISLKRTLTKIARESQEPPSLTASAVEQILKQTVSDALETEGVSELTLDWGVDHIGTYVIASWNKVEKASSYIVRFSYDGYDWNYLPEVTTTSVQFYVLAGSNVYVAVAVRNEKGIISSWKVAQIAVSGTIELPAPSNVKATGIFASVQVSFDFPMDKLKFVDAFEVQIATKNDFSDAQTFRTSSCVASFDVPGFLVGDERTVYVRVRTISRTQTPSAWSSVATATIFKVKGQYIAQATIDSAHIKHGAIETAHIKDASITNAKIASIDASKITSGFISADRIAAGSITADKLAAEILLGTKKIIAGSQEEHWYITGSGIFRHIESAGKIFEKEISSILRIEVITIPPTGSYKYVLPEPLDANKVDVVVIPFLFPIGREGLNIGEYLYELATSWEDQGRAVRIYSRFRKISHEATILQVGRGNSGQATTPANT
ncbi:MAG: phage tail protein, partial [Thermofilaceae archaeon]